MLVAITACFKKAPSLHRLFDFRVQSLDKVIVNFPNSQEPGFYEKSLFEIIPKEKIIRWYVSKIDGKSVECEVIIEKEGVGNSSIINTVTTDQK